MPGRQLLLLGCCGLLATTGRARQEGLQDAVAAVQSAAQSYQVRQAEKAAELLEGILKLARSGMKPKAKSKILASAGHAGCFRKDFKSFKQYIAELLPTVEQNVLSAVLPKFVAQKDEELAMDPKAVAKAASDALEPMRGEVLPASCDMKAIKSRVMTQALGGSADAEELMSQCLMEAAHVSAGCASCVGNFLHGFMGRGMVGLAASCVPKCSPANNICKKGLSDQCLGKSVACLKCMKPRLLEFSDCVGFNTTRHQVGNKVDLLVRAMRDGSVAGGGVQKFVGDVVLALNA
mmetsp:Transcript_27936/g.88763  ORF Transcript_27936/g.88763 Transcript_27936/m.88763 type:complete len:292 (+) Transcript_27936:1-876(+)